MINSTASRPTLPLRVRGHDLRAVPHARTLTQLGGLWNRLPILAFFMILAALGSAAVPGLNGFVGEFPILAGMFQKSARTAVLAATGMILGACYLLWMLRSVVFGPLREPVHQAAIGGSLPDHAPAHDVIAPIGWHEIAGMTPLLLLIVVIGLYPRPFLNQIRPAVARIDQNLRGQIARAITEQHPAAQSRNNREPRGDPGGAARRRKRGEAGQRRESKTTERPERPAKNAPSPAEKTPKQ